MKKLGAFTARLFLNGKIIYELKNIDFPSENTTFSKANVYLFYCDKIIFKFEYKIWKKQVEKKKKVKIFHVIETPLHF